MRNFVKGVKICIYAFYTYVIKLLKYSHYEFESVIIGFYIVDYPILAVENTFLSLNTKFCKGVKICMNSMPFTPQRFTLLFRKWKNRILHS